ncbi:MAG: asparagine--tRNA ligase [bacterium]
MATTAPWVYVEDLGAHAGEPVVVKGWVSHLRSSGQVKFVVLRDGTGIVQCVLSKDQSPSAVEAFDQLTQETSCVVEGTVRQDRRAPGGFEITATGLEVVHRAAPFPITPKEHGVAFLMENRHLWLRSSKQHSVLRVRAEVMRASRDYFDRQGFVEVDSPILTPSAAEGTTTLFETDYFDSKAYLSQSGQLYNEAACMAFGRVYCFGPTFRAEKSKTRRHLTEFWMLEPEIAFGNLETVFELAEGLVTSIVERVLERRSADLANLERDVSLLERIKKPFPRISYDEALEILRGRGCPIDWGSDLGGDEETELSKAFERPVFVHRYPAKSKAFYMQPDPENPAVAMCTDLIAPEGCGEIIGGSERIYDLALLERRLEEFGLPRAAFEWYLDLRRYGSVPHSGFGLGLERLVAWICGIKHIREAIAFPRMMYRVYP